MQCEGCGDEQSKGWICKDCKKCLPAFCCECPDNLDKYHFAEVMGGLEDEAIEEEIERISRESVIQDKNPMSSKEAFNKVAELLKIKGFERLTPNEFKYMFPDGERFIGVAIDADTEVIEVNFNDTLKGAFSPYMLMDGLGRFNG